MRSDTKRYTPEWYVEVNGEQQGPFSIFDLKRHQDITPDTLAWKEGFKMWVPMRNIPELDEVFLDEEEAAEGSEIIKPFLKDVPTEDEVLALNYDPYQWFLWILIVIIIMFYVVYNL